MNVCARACLYLCVHDARHPNADFKYSQSHITHRLNTTPVISLNMVMISISIDSDRFTAEV